ncbi:DMT family transporter [Oceanospirillum linum]|nr:DMT family transporter [Oceanospirillum linum]SEG45191.1 EamA-like transporter family protein [Oleiphilus messinensis]SMP34518.1 EamA-like transporter family protein [Oceanospirillum linum]
MRNTVMSLSRSTQADLLLVLVTLLAGAGWIFSKHAMAAFSPILFLSVRFLIAGIFLGGIASVPLRKLKKEQLQKSALVGFVFAIAMTFWILGLFYGNHVGVGAFLTSLGAVLVPVVSLFFGEKANRSLWYSMPVVVAGLACLSLDNSFIFGWGELSFLISALLFALFFILNSRFAASIPALPLTTIQMIITAAIAFTASLFLEEWQWSFEPDIWVWILASAIIATSGRFLFQTKAQGMAPASHAAIIMTLEPIRAALFASIWLAETMSSLQFVGCALIFSAMLINRWQVITHLLGRKER